MSLRVWRLPSDLEQAFFGSGRVAVLERPHVVAATKFPIISAALTPASRPLRYVGRRPEFAPLTGSDLLASYCDFSLAFTDNDCLLLATTLRKDSVLDAFRSAVPGRTDDWYLCQAEQVASGLDERGCVLLPLGPDADSTLIVFASVQLLEDSMRSVEQAVRDADLYVSDQWTGP